MRTYAREDCPRVRLRQRQRVLARSEIAARIDYAGHASLESSLNDGFTVGIETGGVNVAVAIDEQRLYLSQKR